ncbi:MAG: helix-turn-helix domain-containing protein [Oscillospiraceae bacterium]|nr:helix-turn-helix domain-containing protein [Oscillospiraceae bacterium]
MLNTEQAGARIAQLRKQAKFTQETLAEHLGVSPQAVSKWETGTAMPEVALLCALAETLNCGTDDILRPRECAAQSDSTAFAYDETFTPAPANIKMKARNDVRIIDLPACKMVSSGRVGWGDAFEPGGPMERFDKWFTAYDKTRADRFYPRDFMYGPEDGAWVEWAFAVTEIPTGIDGLGVIDFPGGLFAVAVSVDADGKDHGRVHNGIKDWVKASNCFALDMSDTRFCMGHISTPPKARDVMGYHQMDLYVPIRVREAGEK